MPLILVVGKLLGVHEVKCLRNVADIQVTIERYGDLTFLGTLCGDHHNTVTTLCTIDGGQGGVLQNVDRGNIRGRNIVDVVHLEAIDNEQWVVLLGHRRAATYADVNISTGLTVDGRNLHTGNLTLQGHSS